jgi:hypothetical protein
LVALYNTTSNTCPRMVLRYAEVLEGGVVAVADGDTITLLDSNRQQHESRLAGVDTPEKAQPFGQRSKRLSWLPGKGCESGLLPVPPWEWRRSMRK